MTIDTVTARVIHVKCFVRDDVGSGSSDGNLSALISMMTKHHPRGIFSFTLNIAPLLEIGITNQFKVHGVITEGYDVLNDHRRGH